MSDIPDVVRARLRALAQETTSIQAPNFHPSDLVFHHLAASPHDTITGSWSLDDAEYSFRVIGQLSAHHTFLSAYGDLLSYCDSNNVSLGALLRAKWKLSLVLPSSASDDPEQATLHRQGVILQAIQDASIAASPLSGGTVLGTGFVFRARDVVRAGVYSDNIYRELKAFTEDDVEATKWPDPRGFFGNVMDDRKLMLTVRPPELYLPDGKVASIQEAPTQFTPGDWVEVNCVLRMWDTSNVPVRRSNRRAPVRSYQVAFDSAQLLSRGRLVEPPRTTAPTRPAKKRPFAALTAEADTPAAKVARIDGSSSVAAGPSTS